jgi:hypothetical protein
MKSKNGALEISFSWLFAIVAGIIIVFLAIFISSKLMQSGQEVLSAKTGKEIGIILNPLETEFEAAQATAVTIPVETRINNKCNEEEGFFGTQGIRLDQKRMKKWVETDTTIKLENKYIFSLEQIEGKTFYIFSKPFTYPFKVADLFYFIPSRTRYCFSDAPEEIKEEILNLKNQTYLLLENCSDKDISVCFNEEGCNVTVRLNMGMLSSGVVEKNEEQMYFSGINPEETSALMYAAIFSEKSIYECQVKRLMARFSELAQIYKNKEFLLEGKGCETNLGARLEEMSGIATSLEDSQQLQGMETNIKLIKDANELSRRCLLW